MISEEDWASPKEIFTQAKESTSAGRPIFIQAQGHILLKNKKKIKAWGTLILKECETHNGSQLHWKNDDLYRDYIHSFFNNIEKIDIFGLFVNSFMRALLI